MFARLVTVYVYTVAEGLLIYYDVLKNDYRTITFRTIKTNKLAKLNTALVFVS